MDSHNSESALLRPSVFEIDLDAIAHNLGEIQRGVGAAVKVFAVLKCHAYGFGLQEVGSVVESSGVFGIAVGNLLEAAYLRTQGVTKPILVYSNNLPAAASEIVRYDVMPTVQDLESAAAYARAARAGSCLVRVFVKVDVGLHRNGVTPDEAPTFCAAVQRLDGLRLEGIYSHFDVPAPEEAARDFVEWQFARFTAALRRLEEQRIRVPIRMVAHSSILPHYPHMDLDAVDPGKLIYGLYPLERPARPLDLKPAFRALKTRLIAKKRLVGDGPFDDRARFPVMPGAMIGVVPFGWGDGFPRTRVGESTVLVRGKRVPVLGELSVEHARICLTSVPDAQVGDEVVIIGRQGGEEISLSEVATRAGAGLSELSRSVREPVARLFHLHGRPYKVTTILGDTLLTQPGTERELSGEVSRRP